MVTPLDPTWRRPFAAALGLAAAVAVLGCARAPAPSPRLVVLYATCSLNRGFLSPYGRDVPFTPAFDRFARDALVFERHQTESGQSGTAFASILTGTQAPVHGVYRHPSRLPPDLPVLTGVFADAGFEVHSWLGHPMASARLGYAAGTPAANRHRKPLRAGDATFSGLLERLRRDAGLRVAVVTNFTVTHGPYRGRRLDRLCEAHAERCAARALPGFERLRELYRENHIALSFDFERTAEELGLGAAERDELRAVVELLYAADVVELDERFGRLVDAIDRAGLRDDSLIAFTSDHGEVLFEEGLPFRWTHGFQLAPDVLNVAWMVRMRGVPAGRYGPVTRSIDVMPTLLGLAGVGGQGAAGGGVDLSAALRGEAAPPELLAFSHTALFPDFWWRDWGDRPLVRSRFPDPSARWMWVGVRDGDLFHQLERPGPDGWRSAVYDLAAPPGARVDRFDPGSPVHAARAERLATYKRALAAAVDRGSAAPVARERQLELLRSLGYVE